MSARPRGSSVIRCVDCPRRFVITRRGGCRRCPDCRRERRLAMQREQAASRFAARHPAPHNAPEPEILNHARAVQILSQWQRNSF